MAVSGDDLKGGNESFSVAYHPLPHPAPLIDGNTLTHALNCMSDHQAFDTERVHVSTLSYRK